MALLVEYPHQVGMSRVTFARDAPPVSVDNRIPLQVYDTLYIHTYYLTSEIDIQFWISTRKLF